MRGKSSFSREAWFKAFLHQRGETGRCRTRIKIMPDYFYQKLPLITIANSQFILIAITRERAKSIEVPCSKNTIQTNFEINSLFVDIIKTYDYYLKILNRVHIILFIK